MEFSASPRTYDERKITDVACRAAKRRTNGRGVCTPAPPASSWPFVPFSSLSSSSRDIAPRKTGLCLAQFPCGGYGHGCADLHGRCTKVLPTCLCCGTAQQATSVSHVAGAGEAQLGANVQPGGACRKQRQTYPVRTRRCCVCRDKGATVQQRVVVHDLIVEPAQDERHIEMEFRVETGHKSPAGPRREKDAGSLPGGDRGRGSQRHGRD